MVPAAPAPDRPWRPRGRGCGRRTSVLRRSTGNPGGRRPWPDALARRRRPGTSPKRGEPTRRAPTQHPLDTGADVHPKKSVVPSASPSNACASAARPGEAAAVPRLNMDRGGRTAWPRRQQALVRRRARADYELTTTPPAPRPFGPVAPATPWCPRCPRPIDHGVRGAAAAAASHRCSRKHSEPWRGRRPWPDALARRR